MKIQNKTNKERLNAHVSNAFLKYVGYFIVFFGICLISIESPISKGTKYSSTSNRGKCTMLRGKLQLLHCLVSKSSKEFRELPAQDGLQLQVW